MLEYTNKKTFFLEKIILFRGINFLLLISVLLLQSLFTVNLYAQTQSSNYELALEFEKIGKKGKAKKFAKRALKEVDNTKKSELYTLLAKQAINDLLRIDNKKILKHLDSALHYNPENASAHYLFGEIQLYDHPSLGEKHLKRSFDLNPHYLPTLILLTDYYSNNDNEDATVQYATLAIEELKKDSSYIDPTTKIDLFFKKGEALFYNNELEEAIIALDSVITSDTIDFSYTKFALYTRGVCYNDLEEYDKAFNDLLAATEKIKFKKDPFLTYHLALAYAYKVQPDLEKALYYINISTKLTEKDASSEISDLDLCYALRGEIYLEKKEYQLSINDFLKLDEDENRSYWLGMAYYKAKNYNKSLKHYLYHLENLPDDVEALTETAKCYYQLGNLEKACEYITESIEYYSIEVIEEAAYLQEAMSLQNTYCE